MPEEKSTERKDEYLVKWLWDERLRIEAEIEQILRERRKWFKRPKGLICPKCGSKMTEIEFNGIMIDQCTACEGVWLDAGELDSIKEMEKSALLDRLFSVSIR